MTWMTAPLIALASGVYNLSRIKKVIPIVDDKDGSARVRIFWDDDPKGEVVLESIDAFVRAAGTLVPAPPGFQIISCFKDAEGTVFSELVPVIAFRIIGTAPDDIVPITLEGEPDRLHDATFAVVAADGRCCDPGETGMVSIDDWKQHVAARLRAK